MIMSIAVSLLAAAIVALCASIALLARLMRSAPVARSQAESVFSEDTLRTSCALIAEYESGRIAPDRWSELLLLSAALRDVWLAQRVHKGEDYAGNEIVVE